MFQKIWLFSGLIFVFFLSGCVDTKKFIYFNDIEKTNGTDPILNYPSVKVERGDILQITISTIDKDISQQLNPTTNGITSQNSSVTPGYLVDSTGAIEIPFAGKVYVNGKTTTEINEVLKEALSKTVKNVFVATRLLNFRISVLGDVARPGSFNISNERVSILEALSLAGDINIGARRDDIMLIRETGGQRQYISIDLNNSKTLSSPYFYLLNKDVVYVKTTRNRLFTSTTGFQILPTIFGALSLFSRDLCYCKKIVNKYKMDKEQKMEKTKDTDDIIDITSILNKVLYHWPLYLLVLFLTMIGAYLYLRYTNPIYVSTAKIYIKDDKKGGNSQLSALQDLSFMSNNKLVENEMEVIKSPLLLKDVIAHNRFNVKYYIKGKVSNKEIYNSAPIHIQVLTDSSNVGNYAFNVQILDNQRMSISYPGTSKNNLKVISTYSHAPFSVYKDRFAIEYNPALNLNNDKNFVIKIDSIMPLAYKKANEINTALVNRVGSVFELTYEDVMPKRAADFLNAILLTYNNYTLSDKNLITKNTIEFINGRLDSLGSELSVVERNVENFKKERGITEIQENSRIVLEEAREADQKLNESNIQLSVFENVQRFIDNPNTGTPVLPIGTSDPSLTTMINKYQDLLSERRRLLLSVEPENIILQNLDGQIAETKNSLRGYIAGFKKNAATVRGGLQSRVNRIEGELSKVPTYERQFINIKRQQSVKEALYLFLLQRKEEASVSYASNIVDNKIISPAFIPEGPVKPKRALVFLAFFFAGFIITSIYIYFKYLLNNNISTKKEIEKILNFPVIAEIFKQDFDVSSSTALTERSVLTEQVLNLRNNLKFLLTNVTDSPIILFTSSISGEGKTFLSSHLGNSLTYNNKKAVLLELDLRKPKLSKSLGLDNSKGITNYLIGQNSLDEIINKVPNTERLHIIPSGPIPPNPIELIESDKMKELFGILKQRFDYVIIDTSPVGLVSDAKSLSNYVDCALFVVRFNYTPRGKLKELADNIDGDIFRRVGIIFNGVDINSSYSNYGYGYSKYGYGYGTTNMNRVTFKSMVASLKRRLF